MGGICLTFSRAAWTRTKVVPAVALVLTAGVGVLWFLLAGADPAHACKCAAPPSPDVAHQQAATVFQGEVVGVRGLTPEGLLSDEPDTPELLVRLRVSTVWKGTAHETMFVRTSRWVPSCGFGFIVGREYVVFAGEDPAVSSDPPPAGFPPSVNRCGRTARSHQAGDDLNWLEGGVTPEPGTVAPLPSRMAAGPRQAPAPAATPVPGSPGNCGFFPGSGEGRKDMSALGLFAFAAFLGFRRLSPK